VLAAAAWGWPSGSFNALVSQQLVSFPSQATIQQELRQTAMLAASTHSIRVRGLLTSFDGW